jgi:CubicO group peptidase (beta-lactamase class C family)
LTAHRLLSNSAGVADFAAPFVSHDDSALATDDPRVEGRRRCSASPGGSTRTRARASGWRGTCIEEASGKAYADAMAELVFAPAGMTRATLRPLTAMTHALSVGHDVQAGVAAVIRPAFDNVAMWPAGSAYASADDLAKFVLALFGGPSGLPAGLLDTLSGAHVAMPGEPGVHYGYGLMHFEDRGVRMVMHGGFSRGYGSMIQMAPAQRFAVIVVANTSGQTLPRTCETIKKLFLERGPEVVVKKDPVALAAGDAGKFVGVYVNAGQSWEIVERGGQLALKAEGEEVPLTRTGAWRLSFGAQLENDVAFVAGADGRAEYVFTGLYAGRRRSGASR